MKTTIPGVFTLFILFSLNPSAGDAATVEQIETLFQNGLHYANMGQNAVALKQFETLVATDPNGLPQDYYIQTYSEAYFYLGVLNAQKGDWDGFYASADNLKKALAINPLHARAHYYLAYNLIYQGEIREAKQHYNEAKRLGLSVDVGQEDDFVGALLADFAERSIQVEYRSFFDPGKTFLITIEGDPSGDDTLLHDTINGIEKLLRLRGQDMFKKANVEFIRFKEEGTIAIEKWHLIADTWEKDLWVRYDLTPPPDFSAKTQIQLSETEFFD